MTRNTPIQLVVEIMIWKIPVVDSRTSDTNALSLLDLDSGAIQELFHDPRVDLDRAALAEPDRVLYAARYVPGTIDYYVIDEAKPYAAIFKAALARFPNSSVDITSVTRDHRRALLRVVSDRDAGTFYEFDASDASFTRVLTARRWLDPSRLAPVTPVSIVARDGQMLNRAIPLLSHSAHHAVMHDLDAEAVGFESGAAHREPREVTVAQVHRLRVPRRIAGGEVPGRADAVRRHFVDIEVRRPGFLASRDSRAEHQVGPVGIENIFLVAAIGYAIGQIKIKGSSLGVADKKKIFEDNARKVYSRWKK